MHSAPASVGHEGHEEESLCYSFLRALRALRGALSSAFLFFLLESFVLCLVLICTTNLNPSELRLQIRNSRHEYSRRRTCLLVSCTSLIVAETTPSSALAPQISLGLLAARRAPDCRGRQGTASGRVYARDQQRLPLSSSSSSSSSSLGLDDRRDGPSCQGGSPSQTRKENEFEDDDEDDDESPVGCQRPQRPDTTPEGFVGQGQG